MFSMRIKKSGIYQIINEVNGHFYIGSSKNIKNRWQQWKSVFRHQKIKYKSYLYNAVQKYGIENFTFIIIEECEPSKVALESLEQHYIDSMKPEYNLMRVARNGFQHAPETIERMKTTLLSGRSGGKKAMENGTHIFLTGVSKETRQKIAQTKKANGEYDRLLPILTNLALSEESRQKRKATYKKTGHQQGSKNSQYGTCWITDGTRNMRIQAKDLPAYPDFVKGRKMDLPSIPFCGI